MNYDFYVAHYQTLAPVLLGMMRLGVRVDRQGMAAQLAELRQRCEAIQDRLDELVGATTCHNCRHDQVFHVKQSAPTAYTKAGKPKVRQPTPTYPCTGECLCRDFIAAGATLRGEKDISYPRVIHFLYTELRLPKQRHRGEESLTADEVALRKLLLKATYAAAHPMKRPTPKTERWRTEPTLAVEVLTLLLEHREKAKLATYLEPAKLDPDGRLRCMYKVTTDPGRLASSKNPMGTSYNLQNIPRGKFRSFYLPEPGCLFLAVDYSQSESRFVKVLSKDPAAIEQARLLPHEWDDHSEGARRMFSRVLGIPEAEVDVTVEVVPGTTRRQLAKPIRHGVNYGETAPRIQDALLKDGVVLDLKLCEQLLAAAKERYVMAFQMETRKRIMRHHRLVSSWGRVLDLTGCRLNDETYRRGYAWRGATENADALNQLGLIPLARWLDRRGMRSRINLQCHDEVVVSVHPDEAWDVLVFIINSMEQERVVEGVPISIPAEPKLGTTWACEVKYAELPTRTQFNRDVQALLEKRRAA